MADIELRVHGDGAEGKEALEGVGESAGHAHEATSGLQGAMHELGEELGKTLTAANLFSQAIEAAVENVKEFAAESVKLYEAQETADRNLSLFAGHMTAALKEQAEEFEKTYGVAAEATEKVQTLALAHGADKEQVAELTEATTKWAAVTGTDAASAAQQLVVAVEAGRHSSRQLGIQWEETGDKAQDLRNAIEALNGKLAGADPTAEATLEGRTNRAKLAFENLEKGFGGWIARVESKAGVLDKLASALDALKDKAGATGIGAYLGMAAYGPFGAVAGAGIGSLGAEGPIADAPQYSFPNPAPANKVDAPHEKLKQKWSDDQKTLSQKQDEFDAELELKNEEALNKEWQQAVDHEEKITKLDEDSAEKAEARDALAADDELARQQKQMQAELDGTTKFQEEMLKSWDQFNEHKREKQDAADKKLLKQETKAASEIGAAITNEITSALQNALNGQAQTWQDIAGQTASSILTIVGGVVGAYFGAPQLGTALGSLAGTAANYGIHQIKHEGGTIERYHSGGWPGLGPNEFPIIAEAGEYVASKREVAAAGGPSGVRSALGGSGGGMNITIQTMDSIGTRQFFEGRGGREFNNAVRTGRGSLPKLLGGRR